MSWEAPGKEQSRQGEGPALRSAVGVQRPVHGHSTRVGWKRGMRRGGEEAWDYVPQCLLGQSLCFWTWIRRPSDEVVHHSCTVVFPSDASGISIRIMLQEALRIFLRNSLGQLGSHFLNLHLF